MTLRRGVETMTVNTVTHMARPKMEVNISFRVRRELRDAAQKRATERDEAVSDVLRAALEQYVNDDKDEA